MAPMFRASRIVTRLGLAACILLMTACDFRRAPEAVDPSALLPKDAVLALVRHPSPLLRSALDGLLPVAAWPDAQFDAVAIVRDQGTVGWIGFIAPGDTRTSPLPSMEASPPSLLALVGTGADTLDRDAFFRGSAAAASDVPAWAYLAALRDEAPLTTRPLAILSSTGSLAFLWMDQRPAALASVGNVVPALPARGAVWFADGGVLLSLRSAVHPHIALAADALLSAAVLRAFGSLTAPQDLAHLLQGPGTLLMGHDGGSGSALLLAGSGRDNVSPMLNELRERFAVSRPRMDVDQREFERGFRADVVSLSGEPLTQTIDQRNDGWIVHEMRQQFDNARLVTAERGDAFVIGTERSTIDAFLEAGTGTLSLPPIVMGTQREAAGVIDLDILPPSLASALAPLVNPLESTRLLWSLDRTGGATALTLRAESAR